MGMNTDSYDQLLNPVLESASDEDLQFLVDLILSKASNFLSINDAYKTYCPRHSMYADVIAQEIRTYGGNTFANLFRGGDGPSYSEIACDVARKFNINPDPMPYINQVEDAIVLHVLEKAIDEMSESERREILMNLGAGSITDILNAKNAFAAMRTIFKMGGFKSYQLTVIVANAVAKVVLGHGLRLATNCALTKAMSLLAGPVGWAISGIWTVIDLAGPSFKVTIPAVIYVAMLRKKSSC